MRIKFDKIWVWQHFGGFFTVSGHPADVVALHQLWEQKVQVRIPPGYQVFIGKHGSAAV
jgi:hypothetical protein